MANRAAFSFFLFLFFPLLLCSKTLRITDVTFGANSIILTCNQTIQESDVRFFHLSNGGLNKNIYDISGVLNGKAQSSQLYGNIKAKIAQNKKSRVRVVFYSPGKFFTSSSYEGNHFIIKSRPASSPDYTIPKDVLPAQLNKTIVIDPGHGGKDCGTTGGKKNICEKEIVLNIGKYLANELKKIGYSVHLTRDRDKFIRLKNRTKVANDKNADAFVSIHVNAIGGKNANKLHGLETYFLSPARSKRAKNVAALENSDDIEAMNWFSKETFLNFLNSKRMVESNKLAIDVQRQSLLALKKVYGNRTIHDSGVREGPFWVLVGAQMPSILIETGYLSHPTESKRLMQDKYQRNLAKGIANGIYDYFAKNP